MFNNIFGSDDDDNDSGQDADSGRNTNRRSNAQQPVNQQQHHQEAPDPGETVHGGTDPTNPNYEPTFDPNTSTGQMGKEVMIHGESGQPFAGQWPRNMFESAYENPTQATWVGYKSNPQEGLREIPIEHKAWFRHAAVFGTTGYGKTTFLKNLMIQWAYAGYGFCFIDPKGDGVMDLMQEMPEHRLDDVIWIDPAPESSNKVVGINFLQPGTEGSDEEQAAEKESIIDDLENIIKNESYWGPRMASVFSTLARGMIESEKNYTLLDMYQVLVDEEYREMFVEDVDDPLVRQYTRQIAEEMDQSDLDALIRRLKRLVNNNITREIISHKESSFRIRDAVENGKIILIKNDQDNADAQQMIATGIMRRIWAAIKARKAIPEEERTPYFLVVDEFDDVVTENADVDKMLSKARSFRLSVTLCNQQPSQLPQDIQQAIMGNCDNLLSFNPNNPADARLIMKKFGNYNAKDLMNLGRFKIFTRIMVNNEQSPPFITNTFADYPPLRTYEEAHKAIEQSLEQYGTERLDPKQIAQDVVLDMDASEPGAKDSPQSPGAAAELKKEHDENSNEVTITDQDILESIYALELKQDAKGEFIPIDAVKDELQHRLNEDMYQSIPAEAVEQLNESPHVEKQRRENELRIRLTSEGRQQVVDMTSGSVATGGGDDHRYILKRAFEAFTMADYKVTIPEQEGKEMPDGIAEIPMDMSATSPAEMKAKLEELENEYPSIHRISGGNDLNIEAETTTINKPKQTLTNLRKAIDAGRKCVFCVKDMESEKGDMAYHAKRGASILLKPPLVRAINRRKNLREFYNKSSILEVEDGARAIRPKDSGRQTVWRETPDDGIALYDRKSDAVIQKFDSITQATTPTKNDVPALYRYDQSKSAYVVYVNKPNGQRDRRVYTEKEHLKEEWTPIREPFIPEQEFSRKPREDDWMFVIFPDDDKDIPPQIFEPSVTPSGDITGEYKPLIPHDQFTTPANTTEPEPESEPESEPDHDTEPDTFDTETEQPDPQPADTDDDLDYREFTLVYDGLNDIYHVIDENDDTLCGDYIPPTETEETTTPTDYNLCETCQEDANINPD